MKRLFALAFILLTPSLALAQHTYWRLNITLAFGNLQLRELQFFDSGDSQIATTGGTPSASNTYGGFPASNAFDSNTGTKWAAVGGATAGSPIWLQYQFASGVSVAYIKIVSSEYADQGPINMQLQSSDDGSTFTTVYSWNGVVYTTAGQTTTLNATNQAPTSPAISWRLNVTALGSGGVPLQFAALKFYDAGSSLIPTSAYAATASSIYSTTGGEAFTSPYAAFDGNAATDWATPTFVSPQWIQYDFASVVSVASIAITADAGSSSNHAPTAFDVQYNLGAGWVTAASFTTPSTWAAGETRTFGGIAGSGGKKLKVSMY